jgi:hypothetical protein
MRGAALRIPQATFAEAAAAPIEKGIPNAYWHSEVDCCGGILPNGTGSCRGTQLCIRKLIGSS